jgi:4-hydroxybenzoyl-CoA thioesterase
MPPRRKRLSRVICRRRAAAVCDARESAREILAVKWRDPCPGASGRAPTLEEEPMPETEETRFAPPPGAFTHTVPIRFGHSDPAGIVYFPHYFDMFNDLIEDWYNEELGLDYGDLIIDNRLGFPIVHAECDFKVPSRMGERLELTLLVERLGRASLAFRIIGHLAGVERLSASVVTVMISRDSGRSMPFPDDLRERIEAYRRKVGG